MGLDMYAYKTSKENIKNAVTVIDEKKLEGVFYWRKHPNLHGWFERLYRNKGGDRGASGLIIDFVYPYTKSNRLSSAV